MKLIQRTLADFSELLASDSPAPGGGSVAALNGALGASLILMVTELTLGKDKFAEYKLLIKKIAAHVKKQRVELLHLIDRDTEAFNAVSAVFKMPKDTDEDKKKRSAAMQAALKACTLAPFEVIERSLATLEQAQKMFGKFNTNAASDLGVAVLNLKTATEAAWLNMLINLDGIKDEDFVNEYRTKGEELRNKATALADGLHAKIDVSLGG